MSFQIQHLADLEYLFMQERLWKITAAGQICHQVAFNSRLRFQERSRSWEQKMIAHNVAKCVMDFWHSVEVNRTIVLNPNYSVFFQPVSVSLRKIVNCGGETYGWLLLSRGQLLMSVRSILGSFFLEPRVIGNNFSAFQGMYEVVHSTLPKHHLWDTLAMLFLL